MIVKGKSKRLPRKNLREFKGEPMFLHNLKKCLDIFPEVYVSSESDEVLSLAWNAGAKTIKRPEELCGETPDIPVFQHALEQIDADGIVAVHANNPCIKKELISLCKKVLELGTPEVMTCYPMSKKSFYKEQGNPINGSIRGFHRKRLENYNDPYHPCPEVLIVDDSLEIETEKDYKQLEAFKGDDASEARAID